MPCANDRFHLQYFELADALIPGGSAYAHPVNWSGTAWVTDTDVDHRVIVHDSLQIVRGMAKAGAVAGTFVMAVGGMRAS